MPRLFVAIEVPADSKQALARALGEWHSDPSVRWVRPESLHLTLKFLGETAESAVPAITAALDHVCAGHAPLALSLGGFGAFPAQGAPRVLWAGVHGDVERLAALASAVDLVLVPLGVPHEERPFAPHLTLGRARGDARPVAKALATLGALGSFLADRVVLFGSELAPDGAIHTPLATFPLAFSPRGAQIRPA